MHLKARLLSLCLGIVIAVLGMISPRTLGELLKEVIQELDEEGMFEPVKTTTP